MYKTATRALQNKQGCSSRLGGNRHENQQRPPGVARRKPGPDNGNHKW
jgi:hypothetical protein